MAKNALVTGASRGIGKAIALKLADKGFNIAINYRSSSQAAEDVAAEIKAKGVNAITIQADVSNKDDLAKLINETVNGLGSIDVLVNNAGITRDNLLIRMKEDEWNDVLQTNLVSILDLSEQAIAKMQEQGSGKIINISSVVGVHGNAGQANYSTAKAGVISFTRMKARELMPKVQVNCIAPGLVATDMTASFDLSALADTPLGRAAKPEDIANAVSFLATEGDYVTGQVIEVDGGLSLWSNVQEFAK